MDPADLLALNGPAALTTVLDQAGPLGDELINERLTSLPPDQARLEAARVVAARPPGCWDQGSNTISSRLGVPLHAVRQTLLVHVKEWNSDPRRAATKPLQGVNDIKKRLAEAAPIGPEQRWAALAGQLDQRLVHQGDWPALALTMQRIADQGHDVAVLTRAMTRTPLNDLPAQDLRYRLVAHLDLGGRPATAPGPHLFSQEPDTCGIAPGSCPFLCGKAADAPSLTKRFLAASATAVVTTKMIKTRRKVRETPTLIVMLAASLGDAVGAPGDTCLPWATGVWGEQPSRNRVDDHRWPPHPARHSPAGPRARAREATRVDHCRRWRWPCRLGL